jgi:hypothetical protein
MWLAACFMLVSCLAYSPTLKMEATCSSETSLNFNKLYGIISQKTELFIISCCGNLMSYVYSTVFTILDTIKDDRKVF